MPMTRSGSAGSTRAARRPPRPAARNAGLPLASVGHRRGQGDDHERPGRERSGAGREGRLCPAQSSALATDRRPESRAAARTARSTVSWNSRWKTAYGTNATRSRPSVRGVRHASRTEPISRNRHDDAACDGMRPTARETRYSTASSATRAVCASSTASRRRRNLRRPGSRAHAAYDARPPLATISGMAHDEDADDAAPNAATRSCSAQSERAAARARARAAGAVSRKRLRSDADREAGDEGARGSTRARRLAARSPRR